VSAVQSSVEQNGAHANGSSGLPPAFLIGAARSGTTLLYKILCLHPEVGYISNWVRKYPAAPALARMNRVARALPNQRQRVWFGEDSNAYVYGKHRSAVERMFPMPVEGEPVFEHCGIPADCVDASEVASSKLSALRRSFEGIRRHAGARLIVSKRIGHNRRLPAITAAFPEGRYVVIVRDGRAVAASLSRVDWWEDDLVWWYGGTPKQWREEGKDPWVICAQNWVEELRAIDHGLAHVDPGQVLRISYEELVGEPYQMLARVAAFLGLRKDASWEARIRDVKFPNRNEGWRKLPAEAVATIESIQRDELFAHGFLERT